MTASVVGLDIGNGVLRAAEVLGGSTAKPKLMRYHEVTFPVDATHEGEVIEQDVLVRALKQLWLVGKFKTKDVVLGVGNQRVLTRDLAVPKVPLDRIRETLAFQVQDLLPIPIADAVLDFYPVSETVGDSGPVIQGLLVAAAKASVLANVRAVQMAGLNPIDVDLSPFALTRALMSGGPGQGTLALVHVGATTTCVVIATDGVPQFVRIIPSGGGELTTALVQGLGMKPEDADLIKGTHGLLREAYPPESVAVVETMIRTTDDLLRGITDTLDFYRNNRPTNPMVGIVLSGGGSRLRGFAAALEEVTRLQVQVGDATQRFTVMKSVDSLTLPSVVPAMGVALGLTLRKAS